MSSLLSLFDFRTLRVKLVVASSLLVIGALVVASAAFVGLTHGKEKQRALDHTVATAPEIHNGFFMRLLSGSTESDLEEYVRAAAKQNEVRILMFDYSGNVVEDTDGDLVGTQLTMPENANPLDVPPRRPSEQPTTWQIQGKNNEELTLVAASPALVAGGRRIDLPSDQSGEPSSPGVATGQTQAQVLPYRLGIVVSPGTIARAWLDLLPLLALAAGIALPIAIIFAILVARHITQPLSQLTVAADQMAQGTFDIDVPTNRGDEVGQLSRSFSSMATRVGETHMQMRALVANVSHDMRTPLTSILGFAQALRGGVIKGDAESKHAGDVIYDEVTKLSTRLNDLLLLSEIEAGQAFLQREDVDVSALVAGVVDRVASRAAERGVEIRCDLAPDLKASADRAKLERVLENLLDNARKFTPVGDNIDIRTFLDGSCLACVDVANTATDIDPEELPRLFERFYRRDRARTDRSAGTGLGLPIARDLMELHGGTLAASIADGTITFRASIPQAPAPQSPNA